MKCAVVLKNTLNPAYRGAKIGIGRRAAELGVEVKYLVPEVPDSIQEQVLFCRQLVSDPPDAVLLVPAHANQLNGSIAHMTAAGIPVVTFVGMTESKDHVAYVGSNDYQMTYDLADHILRAESAPRTLGIVDGNPRSTNFEARARGFREAIAAHPKAELAAERIGYYLRDSGYEASLELLRERPDIDGMLIANDFMAMGTIQALEEFGRDAVIGSVNATPEGIEALVDGKIRAIAGFDAFSMAVLALEAAVRHHSGEALPKEILLPVEIVTYENVARWQLPYEARPLPRWPLLV